MGEKKLTFSYEQIQEVVTSLKACPTFADVPEKLLEKIAHLTSWQNYEVGETVLAQNQMNTQLFFLAEGQLGVFVDDEQVSVLKRRGDVIGEMSVISSKLASATIRALTPAKLVAIDAKDFSGLSRDDAEAFQHTMYRVFALILTEKLAETNQKARDFEIANRRLIAAQSELEEANRNLEQKVVQRTTALAAKTEELIKSHLALEQRNNTLRIHQKKLEDISAFRNSVIERIDQFVRVDLSRIGGYLGEISGTHDEHVNGVLQSLNADIEKAKAFFEPLTIAYHSEIGLAKQRVLLLEPNIKEQVITKMALGGTGVHLDIAGEEEAGRRLISENSYNIVCTGPKLISLIKFAKEKNQDIKIVFVTSEDIANYLSFLEQYPSISNVVSFSDEDRSFTIKNITTTISKLANQDLFGLEKYISWGTEVLEVPITGSAQRREIVKNLDGYLTSIAIRKSVISRITAVAEELLMNAIYDAPVGSDGKSLYNHLPRTVKIELKESEYGLFRYACDGLLVAISVADPFGALTRETIVNYLRNCYGHEPGSLNSLNGPKGGAGLGLFQLIATSDLVIFNVNPKRKTEVIALFSIDPRANKVKKTPSFHFFYR